MNRTISINLSGMFFHIEDDACSRLEHYLGGIGEYYAQEEGAAEIIEDIEARIAELFSEQLAAQNRKVVSGGDVDAVIEKMGHPEEFEAEPVGPETASGEAASASSRNRGAGPEGRQSAHRANRRFFRDPDNKVLGGVCAGIAAYFGIADPIWVRIAFVLATFVFGNGVLLYLLLWAIVPAAKTAADRLAMRGEDINVSNIEKTVREGFEEIRTKFEDFNKGEGGEKARDFFSKAAASLRKLLPLLLLFALKLAKVFTVFVGLVLLFSLVVTFVALGVSLVVSFGVLSKFVFSSLVPFLVSAASSILVVAIPIILLGDALFRRTRRSTAGYSRIKWRRALAAIWVASLVVLFTVGSNTYAKGFSNEVEVKEELNLGQPSGGTLYLNLLDDADDPNIAGVSNISLGGNMHKSTFDTQNRVISIEDVQLDVAKSENGAFGLVKKLAASGGQPDVAEQNARNINYQFAQPNDSTLQFGKHYTTKKGDKWRNQKLRLTLLVPVGRSVFLDAQTRHIIHDIDNVTNTYDRDMVGRLWTMTEAGLAPADALERNAEDAEFISKNATFIADMPTSGDFHYGRPKTYDFANFDGIKVSGNYEVLLVPGDFEVSVSTIDDKAMDNVEIKARNGKLVADNDDWKFWKKNRSAAKLYIALPDLESLDVSGVVNARLSGFELDEISIETSGASHCSANLKADFLKVDVSGASQLTLLGETDKLVGNVSGATQVNARKMAAREADMETSGASSAVIKVTETLKAEASGASSLSYEGQPETKRLEKSGAASITDL